MHEWGFRVAHIPGSMHFNTVEEAREGLDLDDEIVVYCTDPACVASQFAYRWLIESGYTNVRRYEGGVSDWATAGHELESDPASDSSGGGILPSKPAHSRQLAPQPHDGGHANTSESPYIKHLWAALEHHSAWHDRFGLG
jgi:3-mercaptopyruvate sulfurtransferase SseA